VVVATERAIVRYITERQVELFYQALGGFLVPAIADKQYPDLVGC
jgi:hypothetical protein